jgi:hypothetical protein
MASSMSTRLPAVLPPTYLGAFVGGVAATAAAALLLLSLLLRALSWLLLCDCRPCASSLARRGAVDADDDAALLAQWRCTRRVEEFVRGAAVEVLHWRPARADAREAAAAPRILVFFPGNPGSPHFYARMLAALAQSPACRGAHIYCVGHAGHSVSSSSRARFGLAAQVACGAAAALALRARHGGGARCALALGGHSVGAHVALRAAAGLAARDGAGAPPLWALLLLFPTLQHIGRTANGARLTPLFRHGRTAAWLAAAALAAAPPPLRAAAVTALVPAAAAAGNAHTRAAAASLLHADVAAAALHMARDEMDEIGELREAEAAALEAARERALLYFGGEDHWVADGTPEELAARFRRARVVRCGEGHPHAFPLLAHSSARLAAICAAHLDGVAAGRSAGRSASRSASRGAGRRRAREVG